MTSTELVERLARHRTIAAAPRADKRVRLAGGREVVTRTLLAATGMSYREHPAPGVAEHAGAGVYYGAATTEAPAFSHSQGSSERSVADSSNRTGGTVLGSERSQPPRGLR